MERTKQPFKVTIHFWFKEIIPKAFCSAFKKLGIRGVLMELGVSAIGASIYFSSAGKQTNIPELGKIAIATAIVWGILLIITIVVFIFREPAKIHGEQEKKLNEQEKIINPDVSLKIEPVVGSPDSNTQWLFLRLINESGACEITDCTADLMSVESKDNQINQSKSLPSRLAWGAGYETLEKIQSIPRGGTVVLDIAHSDLEYNEGRFDLGASREWIKFPPGRYEIGIQINGKVNGNPFRPIRKSYEIELGPTIGIIIRQVV